VQYVIYKERFNGKP